jgi:hypothetical protein
MKKAILSMVTVLAATQAPVGAEAPTTVIHSVQCYLAAGTLLNSSSSQQRMGGMLTSMFFAGQVFGANPKIDLTEIVKSEAPKLDGVKIKSLQLQCGQEMGARAQQMKIATETLPKSGAVQ